MKRLITVLSIAALALTTSVAFAHDREEDDGDREANVSGKLEASGHFNFPPKI